MKKQMITLILLCLAIIPASAQDKHADLAFSISSPKDGAIIPYGDTLKIFITAKNLGPDALDSNNEIMFANKDFPLSKVLIGPCEVNDSLTTLTFTTESLMEDTDYVITYCYYLNKNGHLGIIDTNQSNDTACVTVTLKHKDKSSINKIEESPYLIYPNPAKDFVYLNLENLEKANGIRVTVVDIYGKKVIQLNQTYSENKITKLAISNLSSGIYFIRLSDGEHIINKKLVIK